MRIDIVTIFPEFFGTLDVSLLGKARQSGLIDTRVHDLRDATTDKHRTVDDTPYGGGAGMVMKPEPWGDTLDAILADPDSSKNPILIVPSPAGEQFTQAVAK
ncbi:MAG: tRNA (guanosine(37)-N1)-methyltransferase TrmD, partial [Aurantimicrobium sp.]